MVKYLTLLFLTILSFPGNAQTNVFFNNGAVIYIANSADVYVGIDLLNGQASGLLANGGRLTVKGDVVNYGEITGGSIPNQSTINDTGVFNLCGNWENNADFKADASTVFLKGNTQIISGNSSSAFYNLHASGIPYSIKKLHDADAYVTNSFVLKNGIEFATESNKLSITNSAISAIEFDSISFVSCTDKGRLSRAMASTANYYFPVGWNDNAATIRPVIINPNNNKITYFDVRFVKNNPTDDGFDLQQKFPNIINANSKFYHLVHQTAGDTASAALSILFNSNQDGNWNSIARWQGAPQWEDIFAESGLNYGSFNSLRKNNWYSNIAEAYVLINAEKLESEYAFPSAFSPNNDNHNDAFGMVPGSVASLENMTIFNRWGTLVFDKERDKKNSWDGTYLGKSQPMGTYMMRATIKLLNGELKSETRSISLIY